MCACADVPASFGPTPAQARANSDALFGAFVRRFTNVYRTPRYARARDLLLQHALTPSLFGSASFDYEPSRLRGRRGLASIDETATHAGVALAYQAPKHWTVSVSYDYDDTDSDDASRLLRRDRFGVGASYSF